MGSRWMWTAILVGVVLVVVGSLAKGPALTPAEEQGRALITPGLLEAHTRFLADDLLEGRAPGSRGGELAAKYIAAQFERLGLEPGGTHGTYFQPVPMVGKTIDSSAALEVKKNGTTLRFNFYDDFVPGSDLEEETVPVAGEVVFVGYGITAPEYDWDDFKGANLKGKLLLMLVNDPPATAAEPNLFGGKALTYYGRWTYKYESAAHQGAAGAILIHTTPSAGYPFSVVQSSWSRERFSLAGSSQPKLPLQCWISQSAAEQILRLGGQSLVEMQKAAASRNFRPISLGVRAETELEQTLRHIESPNVVGVLPGSNPEKKHHYVVYTAHYDHLGIGKAKNGDNIYNGAADNAMGVAGLLAIAEAMARAPETPKRSQVFIGIAAEEYGLLGSEYYALHPLFPPAATVANINMDGLNSIGPTRDLTIVGDGKSDLDEIVRQVADRRGMTVEGDAFPEQGYFYRSDQFNFAKIGIPAVYLDNGLEVIGKPAGWGKQKHEEYVARDYHQPSDEIKADWDWRGAEQMAEILFEIGWQVANRDAVPEWNPGAEFRAIREKSLREAGLF